MINNKFKYVAILSVAVLAISSGQKAVAGPTMDEIKAYVEANKDNPTAIANAMKEHGVSLEQVRYATGYKTDVIEDYVKKSGNNYLEDQVHGLKTSGIGIHDEFIKSGLSGTVTTGSTDGLGIGNYVDAYGTRYKSVTSFLNGDSPIYEKSAAGTYAKEKFSDAISDSQIEAFVNANKDNPAAIADAMKKHGIGLDRIVEATGYSKDDVYKFADQSGSKYLQDALNIQIRKDQVNAISDVFQRNDAMNALNKTLALEDLGQKYMADYNKRLQEAKATGGPLPVWIFENGIETQKIGQYVLDSEAAQGQDKFNEWVEKTGGTSNGGKIVNVSSDMSSISKSFSNGTPTSTSSGSGSSVLASSAASSGWKTQ
jgi:lambda repressor-like predicted transcriptional regulator